MKGRGDTRESQRGSILLPVILLLLLIATAATAMTLKARTSLREGATRRDRLALSLVADGAVRATALVMASAAANRAAPPFGLDGTPQVCRLDQRRRLTLTVQDEGGLVDLNKGSSQLIEQVLRRSGLSAPEVGSLAKAITAHRADAPRTQAKPVLRQPNRRQVDAPFADAQDFVLTDEIGDLPGVDTPMFTRLQPLFTTANRSAGVDPSVASPAIRALVPPKEFTSAPLDALTAPSNHSDFTITAQISTLSGPSFTRRALLRLDPDAGPNGRFTTWDAPPLGVSQINAAPSRFCQRLAAALGDP